MPKTRVIPVQRVNPDGSVSVVTMKQLEIIPFLKEKVEEIPPVVTKDSKKILDLGFIQDINFKMYADEAQYWCLRMDLEAIHPEIKRQFSNLCREYVAEFDCFWLEEHVDYKFMSRDDFLSKFPNVKNFPVGRDLVLLSVEGIIKLLSRSSKMKIILFWLIKKFMEYRILKFEIEKLWDKIQKTESPAETYFYLASMRHINIECLEPQVIIGNYRGDFVIDGVFLVMIKGWKWHSKKEKVYSDTIRERYIQKQGYILITFWAQEVFEDVDKCVTETIEIMSKHKDLLKDPNNFTKKSNKKYDKNKKEQHEEE